MIKFFRKIRQKLLSENKISKYILYAIGEIVLVVIGILIALQINNWNNSKNDLKEEITILKNIKNDVLADTLDLAFNLEYHRIFLKNEKKLNEFIYGNKNVPESQIDFTLSLGSPLWLILHQASFTNLQNNDLGIIKNNDLKQEISRHYDFFIRSMLIMENEKKEFETYSSKLPYYLKYFTTENSLNILSAEKLNADNYYNPNFERISLKLIDPEGLKEDNAFKVILAESIFFRQTKIKFYEDLLDRTKNIVNKIDEELEILEANQ